MNIASIAALSGTGTAPATGDLASAAKPTDAQRKQVAAQFEAILVRQLLSKSVGSMLGSDEGVAGTVYGDMMTDVLAQKLTAGGGLGLAHMIEKQLTVTGSRAHLSPDSSNPPSS